MFGPIVAVGCFWLLAVAVASLLLLPLRACGILAILLWLTTARIKRDRWAVLRTHRWSRIRYAFQCISTYHFIWKLDRAYRQLPPPVDSLQLYPGGVEILDEILASGPDTFQKKPTNRAQIESLMECVCGLVEEVQQTEATPLVLDIGAGKALLTRAIYEALHRSVAVVALDSRRPKTESHKTGDQFYDPVVDDSMNPDDEPYTRVVADVRHLAAKTVVPLAKSKHGGVIAITKHLCGGATDSSLMALCHAPLDEFVGACCLAPCCHQKTKKDQYCNVAFLESMGFCRTHVGMHGLVHDSDFRIFGMLISMSRSTELQGFEYKKSLLLALVGFQRAKQLGRQCRRLIEEGRMRYLRAHGFDVHLVRYCDESITGDNLAIIARRPRLNSSSSPAAPLGNKAE
jgi:hypothetical protein